MGAALVPAAAGEARVYKQFNLVVRTDQHGRTARAGGRVAHQLAGAQSNWCIRATAYGALERGYDLTLVKDAHTTSDLISAMAPGSKLQPSCAISTSR